MSAVKNYGSVLLRAILMVQLLSINGPLATLGQPTSAQAGSPAHASINATGSQQEVNVLMSSVMLSHLKLISLMLEEKKSTTDQGTAGKLSTVSDSHLSAPCPSGFTNVPSVNGCYMPVLENLVWPVAAIRCNSIHEKAHLVHINSEIERLAVAQILSSQNIAACASNYGIGVGWWTGGRQIDPWTKAFSWKYSSTYDFTKHSDVEMRYKRWFSQQPDFHTGYPSCVCTFASRNQFEWDDCPCSDTYCSLCEIDM